MQGRWRIRTVVAAMATVAAAALSGPAVAAAQPPNDNRDSPTVLNAPPVTVSGTTVGATVESDEPGSQCGDNGPSVWYELSVGKTAPAKLAVQVNATGDLDAVVDVFVRQRSQNIPVTCQATDNQGEAVFTFAPQAQTTYLIRVAQLANSASGTFTLGVFQPPPPAHAPGAALGAGGASGTLERVVNVAAAYSAQLTAGVSYRVNLASSIQNGCMRLGIYAPGTRSFTGGSTVGGLGCQGYRLFTPQQTGLYSFLVSASDAYTRGQRYHLQVAPATVAETAPGVLLPNGTTVRAHLDASRINVLRLYQFDVTTTSNLTLTLGTGADTPLDLELLSGDGHELQCQCAANGPQTLSTTTHPGRYFVVVRARDFSRGNFTLRRQSRTITQTAVLINHSRYVQVNPGTAVSIEVDVAPQISGPATLEIERFDPVAGWQFYRSQRVTVSGGTGTVSFTPPSAGQWLATGAFLGTGTASPSTSRSSRVLVAGPLSPDVAFPGPTPVTQ